MTDLLLTLDAGSGGCKALLFDAAGQEVARSARPYAVEDPQPGWVELSPHTVRDHALLAAQDVLEGQDASQVRGVGVSAQLGVVAVDERGEAVTNVLTWMDKRAQAEAAEFDAAYGPEALYAICGRRVDPEWSACKILWLKKNDPERYAATHKFLTLKDYLLCRLTGKFVIDETQASYSMLFNVRERRWHDEFFDRLELDKNKMPEVLPATAVAGTLRGEIAQKLGLSEGVPVVTGASDGTMAALGAGLTRERTAANVVGTTDVFHACTDQPKFDQKLRTLVTCHALPGTWVQGGPMSTTGGCLKWFSQKFAQPEIELAEKLHTSPYILLDKQVEDMEPGSEGLFFFPSLVGERTPFWNPKARGVAFGLSLHHEKRHVYRAILEGSAFSARQVLSILEEQSVPVDQIILVGGGAKSQLWAQIRADVCAKPVVVPKVEEATGLGTALLLAVAIGLYPDLDAAIESTLDLTTVIEPNDASVRAYGELYERYATLHTSFESLY